MRPLLAALALALATAPASADMYTPRELAADRSRIEARVAELREILTRPVYLPSDGGWLADVPVEVPDVGEGGDPLGFHSDGRAVVLPLAGLRFIEDLTLVYAWRYRAGRTLEPLDEYLAMLRWRPEGDWPGGAWLDPLETFGVPPRIWESDPEVGALGTALRNEAWAFILAHELAHIYFRHPGNQAVSPATSRANEVDADAFALEVMQRASTVPLGAILYFQATAAFYASRAEQPTDEAWARWQREEATHPVNADRLLSMARHLQRAAREEPDPARADALAYIGDRLASVAEGLTDPGMQQLIVRRAIYNDPADLRER